ncbi:hypothetical protein NQZ68_003614 [Dissostichus eleginoides]|nr:hypothetical protein NQZ68_003614 [Dissostichus eleginoides]
MSISVNLKKISNLPGRSDRKVELCFRGFTHKTKALQCENLAIFNEPSRRSRSVSSFDLQLVSAFCLFLREFAEIQDVSVSLEDLLLSLPRLLIVLDLHDVLDLLFVGQIRSFSAESLLNFSMALNLACQALKDPSFFVPQQHFRWPHYGKEIRDEVLSISVYNCSKVFSNRLLGKLVISLQHVVTTGRVLLREPLTDSNYSLTEIYIELDIRYHPVEGAAGSWEGLDFIKVEDQDESALVFRNVGFTDPESQLTVARPGLLEREARRLGRSLVRTGNEDEDDDEDDFDDDIMDLDASDILFTPLLSRCRPMSRNVAAATPRVQGFQANQGDPDIILCSHSPKKLLEDPELIHQACPDVPQKHYKISGYYIYLHVRGTSG